MAREDPQLKLRLSEEVKRQIADAAKANGRSVNAEIVARIEMAESLKELLSNFESAKERILAQEAREADLKKQVTRLHGIATSAQDINRQLIAALMQRLGMTEEEITAITKPTKAR
ncbi:MAG TPA: Arc family DNA-binding protein [Pseudaminobacter sp.]|nr:Arc family DNA-binding protein [Pseudaminobacter sp.]